VTLQIIARYVQLPARSRLVAQEDGLDQRCARGF
jgi:hypothetical protein